MLNNIIITSKKYYNKYLTDFPLPSFHLSVMVWNINIDAIIKYTTWYNSMPD